MPGVKEQQERHILLIEDDIVAASLIAFLLKREGYSPQIARDGQEAYDLINQSPPPHLVLLDRMLPYMDGLELLEHIRCQTSWQQVPIVMLTATNTEQSAVEAFDAGVDDYIVKPFRPQELMARIRRFFRVNSR
ncbi:hypothetical protein BST81_08365 [Leptolyngbya sp. 'hensonii']|uniref:response regulator transcription factor n=1 Tax=Leptolyngbya sp. 'hensonii' TaxID=1922337 RepID=UPI00094F8481|nr:response regulator transcription factor [Leptolyngbya sp. 'hensonii']OLP18917.1 hypothetical protein BST81_08365 [Leptolyngbya sp. 'hensonii']